MATNLPPSSSPSAVVIDASIAIAIVTKELPAIVAANEIADYTQAGAAFYAPGVFVSEVLYVLCRKLENGLLTTSTHAQAIEDFQDILDGMSPAPSSEFSFMARAEEIRVGYSCRRSADGLYIALADQLAQTVPTTLLTFDRGLSAQAARHAPTVKVRVF